MIFQFKVCYAKLLFIPLRQIGRPALKQVARDVFCFTVWIRLKPGEIDLDDLLHYIEDAVP